MDNNHLMKQTLPKSFAPLSEQNLDFSKVDDLMLVHGRHHELSENKRFEMLDKDKKYHAQN